MGKPLISRDAQVLKGTPVFFGTSVPVQTLLDYLEAGRTIDDFLERCPAVTREQVIAFLEEDAKRLTAIRQAQALVRRYVGADRCLSAELIAERRAEAE